MRIKPKQDGIILLGLLLALLAAGSYVLLKALNVAASRNAVEASATRNALKEAKLALIGYAVSYPERSSDPDRGPGRLPCPDYDFFDTTADPVLGSADSCSRGAGTETGLFPWFTIETHELRDASGARLWYAVSDVFRANAGGMINSDTSDATPMVVDGSTQEIVAIIIAPGESLEGQSRSSDPDAQYDPDNYLEGQNASRGDNIFTAAATESINDELVTITRQELMNAVQRRILREVNIALNDYHRDPDNNAATTGDEAYPWLRDFGDPDSIAVPTIGSENLTLVRRGHLPLHRSGQAFAANFNFNWNIQLSEGSLSHIEGANPPNNYPSDSCAHLSACYDPVYDHIGPNPISGAPDTTFSQGVCIWSELDTALCIAVETFTAVAGTVMRTYTISFQGIEPTYVSPSANSDRSQTFNLSGVTLSAGQTITIQLEDELNGAAAGTTELRLVAGDAIDTLNLTDIPFYLASYDHTDIAAVRSPGDLPQWFAANDWHRQLMFAYAQAERPEDTSAQCTAGTDCLSLQWERTGALADLTRDDLSAVLILSSADLGTGRPSIQISDYFEGENANADDTFAKASLSAVFNDQVLAIEPND